ncbi:MAG TPA: hypothetical protein VHG71_01640 [Verrucomicrobiae bacterium]|nr:hypothetical protein [Verrucomicrobiae bacterium]
MSEENPQLGTCGACHNLISKEAFHCPHCGYPIKSPIPTLFYLVAVVWLIIGIGFILIYLNHLLSVGSAVNTL